MKILVRFNKNIAIPRQVKSFKLFDLGIVSTTIDDLLDSTTIEIDDQTLPILKINNSSFIEYYLINDLGLTPGYSYPYYTDDFMKEVTIGDLVLINNGQMGEENVQSDWNQINILADDFIKNKPELFSGDYNDLINTPALVTNHSELNLDDGTNPHGTTKYDVDLGNANNTSDADKPISTATQSALNGKANTIHSHVISDVNGLQTALNSKLDKVTTNDVEKVYVKNADGTQGMKPVSEFGGGNDIVLTKFFQNIIGNSFTANTWYSFDYGNGHNFFAANFVNGINYGTSSSPTGTPSRAVPSLNYLHGKKLDKLSWHTDYCDQINFAVSIKKYDLISGSLVNGREILNQEVMLTAAGPNTQGGFPYTKNKIILNTTDAVDTPGGAQCSVYFLFYKYMLGSGGGSGSTYCYFNFN